MIWIIRATPSSVVTPFYFYIMYDSIDLHLNWNVLYCCLKHQTAILFLRVSVSLRRTTEDDSRTCVPVWFSNRFLSPKTYTLINWEIYWRSLGFNSWITVSRRFEAIGQEFLMYIFLFWAENKKNEKKSEFMLGTKRTCRKKQKALSKRGWMKHTR